jgi:hypothetical protein
VRKANAVCSESNERVRALGPEPPILTADQADWIEALTESDRSAVAKLLDLEPPESGRATIDAMLSDFERGLGKGETSPKRLAPRTSRDGLRPGRMCPPGSRRPLTRQGVLD